MIYTNKRQTYSRWASEEEIKSSLCKVSLKSKSSRNGGIPLFADSDAVYIEDTDTHSLIFGSTGSKKTRLIGMPALQLYARAGESFIASDPKGELYEKTFPLLKKQKYKIFVLNLREPLRSNSWNPLTIPYRLYWADERDRAIAFVADIASCIMREKNTREPYWSNSAADLLTGLILTLFECAGEQEIHLRSLRTLRAQAFKVTGSGDAPFIREQFLNRLSPHSVVYPLLCGTAEVCDTTRGCIVSTFDQAIRPFFSQDNLLDMLSGDDLDMSAIGTEKTAVFLINPDEHTLYHHMISVFVKQCYTQLLHEAHKLPSQRLRRRVNFLLDEFSTLPHIDSFPSMITAARSRNIRFNLIVQSMSQLKDRYGIEADTIKGNCENLIFLHSKERHLLEELIFLAGTKCNEEPLISPTLLQRLSKDEGEALLFHKREYPFVTTLMDIDCYPDIPSADSQVCYPMNFPKARSVFDFEKFCRSKGGYFFSQLFSGRTLEEISNDRKGEEEYYMITDDDMGPIFTTVIPE